MILMPILGMIVNQATNNNSPPAVHHEELQLQGILGNLGINVWTNTQYMFGIYYVKQSYVFMFLCFKGVFKGSLFKLHSLT